MKKLCLATTLLAVSLVSLAQLKIVNPLCENRHNPIGLDITQPRFSWQLSSDKRGTNQTAYELVVEMESSGKRKLIFSSGRISSDQSVHIPYKGPMLETGKRYYWRVRVWDNHGQRSNWSETSFWQMAILQAGDWKAKWITTAGVEDSILRPSPLFRNEFTTSKKISSASLYITSHGLYEAFINGKRVGDDFLTPGWTSYNKRLQYQVYDVTDLLKTGPNAIGVHLGSGWYRGQIAWNGRDFYGKTLVLLAQLQISYTDGTTETIITDDKWKSSIGAVQYSEIYHGEINDARKEKQGWLLAGYNDAGWNAARITDLPFNTLVATYNEPIKKHESFKPIKIFTTPRGELVADFGQNLTGFVELKVKGRAGDSIKIYHAEVLDKAGNFYTENLRVAKQENIYILKGNAEESFHPHFTFQGFRYIRVEGFPGELKPENITAFALYSDMPLTGTFTSSHTLLNQLQHNIQWGQNGNFLDLPTDCPQRDERLGWTGDAQVFARTASFNRKVDNFFAKWLKDLSADQHADGKVPHVIPDVLNKNEAGATGWADAATIIPWTMYIAYGDTGILAQQYASMKAWVEYQQKNTTNDLRNKTWHYGDWLFFRPFDDNDGRSAVTDKNLIAQCFYAYSVQLMINAATVLGKTEDVQTYSALLPKIKAAFVKEFVTANGRLVSGTQTAYVLALHFDMLPEELRAQAAARLVENIQDYGTHLTTGFLGTPYLCHVLSRFGYAEWAYKLLLQESYPSWLYPVKMGATTIWERWNGIRTDGSFEPASMNSFNHYAYGAIGDWMYRVVAGIDTYEDSPGYKHIRIQPLIGGELTEVSATLQTYYGPISSHWKVQDKELLLEVEIPANTKATVFIPGVMLANVKEAGQSLTDVKGIRNARQENTNVVLELGAGKYVFTGIQTDKQVKTAQLPVEH